MVGRVRIWLKCVGDPWENFGGVLEVFPQFGLKIGHFRKTYRIHYKPTRYNQEKNGRCWR